MRGGNEMESAAKKLSHARWDKENTVRVNTKLNKNTDADIIELIERAESKQGLIKQALREYIVNHKEEREG